MRDDLELAWAVSKLADELDARGYPSAGGIRQLARRVVELTPDDEPTHPCGECGTELDQPPGGGRRLWCDDACRKRHARRVRNVSASETMPEP